MRITILPLTVQASGPCFERPRPSGAAGAPPDGCVAPTAAIGITLRGAAGGADGAGPYNPAHPPLRAPTVSRPLPDRAPGAREPPREPAELERRRGPDRRTSVLRALVLGSMRPRRQGPRRSGEQRLGAVDWHHPWWLAVATLIVALSCADAALTLLLINQGAYEVNPLLATLVRGSAAAFIAVKVGLTGIGIVCLTMLARLKAFGRLPVPLILYAVLAGYVVLIVYELALLGML